ncbi:chromate efflux transporter [Chelativorans sp. AA-79]|uniref:chromate efflux transporter n=1 Tax=Chelativorans sp. AA-79 TaxID=3028735 RepID=UPI0023F688B2|nr:chromate efflux transporter [Chelativorans sp. AA-79]WEX08027.1 chromate efflux transporter [Chelativorans sp. AA-79]
MDETRVEAPARTKNQRGSPGEVFAAFLKLGLTSFGGPIAHLGYFRDELVVRRRWIDEKGYADLVALCQFLPGPASSQVGFALGLLRGGPLGAAAAWTAFTLPSAILLVLFALGAAAFGGPVGSGIIHGLKVVAVAIVAQAVWGMARTLCPDRARASIALAAVLIIVVVSGSIGQITAIVAGGLAGLWLCRSKAEAISGHMTFPVSHAVGTIALVLFFALLFGLPALVAATDAQGMAVFDSFYRAGSLVFGGGHVVLPLLETETVRTGWVSADQFLAGYGAAQAVPGPLFTFAAYLGTVLGPEPNGLVGAAIALVAIFLPGFLLLIGVIPYWDAFRSRPTAQALMRGANAAVVGILGAALYQPVWTGAILGPYEFALALTCFVLLMAWKAPPWIVVIVAATGGVLIGLA